MYTSPILIGGSTPVVFRSLVMGLETWLMEQADFELDDVMVGTMAMALATKSFTRPKMLGGLSGIDLVKWFPKELF